jgi:hypothetical protein
MVRVRASVIYTRSSVYLSSHQLSSLPNVAVYCSTLFHIPAVLLPDFGSKTACLDRYFVTFFSLIRFLYRSPYIGLDRLLPNPSHFVIHN